MLHGKPMQFSQHRANMVKLAPFRYNPGCIILAALQSVDYGVVLLHIIGCYSNPGEMLRWHQSSYFPPQASIRDIASHLDVTSDGLNAILS